MGKRSAALTLQTGCSWFQPLEAPDASSPSIELNKTDLTIDEGQFDTFEIHLSQAAVVDTSVTLTLTYHSSSGQTSIRTLQHNAIISAGSSSVSITVESLDDSNVIPDDKVSVAVSAPNSDYTTKSQDLVISVIDNDGGAPIQAGMDAPAMLLRDLNFAPKSSNIATVSFGNGKVLFSGTDAAHGTELWITDGTSQGTRIVKDILPGTASSQPAAFFVNPTSGLAYFIAYTPDVGFELWRTDGTATGTFLVKDIYSGVNAPIIITPKINFGNKMIFVADDSTSGRELWVTDGTTAGTEMLADFNPGTANSTFNSFALFNGAIYFSLGPVNAELWKTNGTVAGTTLVKQMAANVNYTSYDDTFIVNGTTLFFEGNDTTNGREPWKSDGTTAGTVLLKNVNTATGGSAESSPQFRHTIGGLTLFSAYDSSYVRSLWVTDGTIAGTVMLKDINAGAPPSGVIASNSTVLDSKLLFRATTASDGDELWVTDGTPSGTTIVKDIVPGLESSRPSYFTRLNGTNALFMAANSTYQSAMVHTSDGTSAGTIAIPAGLVESESSNITVYASGTKAVFSHQEALWTTLGTAESLTKLIATGVHTLFPDLFNGLLTYASRNGELSTTTLLSGGEVALNTGCDTIDPFRFDATKVILLARCGGNHEPYVYDTSNATVTKLAETDAGSMSAVFVAQTMNTAQNKFYFLNLTTKAFWVTDGTPVGTIDLSSAITPTGSSTDFYAQSFGNKEILLANNAFADFGRATIEMWATDGTTGTTVKISPSAPFRVKSHTLSPYGNKFYFDGTEAGTKMRFDINPGSASSYPASLKVIGTKLYMNATKVLLGTEMWAMDL